jgi:hypothetical protein
MINAEFNKMKQRLLQANAIITDKNTQSVLSNGKIESYKNQGSILFPNWTSSFYKNLNGLYLTWRWSQGEKDIQGFFSIYNFDKMITSHQKEDLLWSIWYEEEDIERIKQHRVFENIIGADAYITVKFLPDQKYKLYYVGDGYVNDGGSEDLPEIPLTIEQYIKITTGYFGVT